MADGSRRGTDPASVRELVGLLRCVLYGDAPVLAISSAPPVAVSPSARTTVNVVFFFISQVVRVVDRLGAGAVIAHIADELVSTDATSPNHPGRFPSESKLDRLSVQPSDQLDADPVPAATTAVVVRIFGE